MRRLAWVMGGVVLALCTVVGGTLFVVLRDLPSLGGMQDYRPPVAAKVFDRNGELIASFYKERRTVVRREDIPGRLVNAFLAAEDADFYGHGGVDPSGIAAAILQEVAHRVAGSPRRGGSTITQQVAKTFLLSPEQTYTRKIREAVLAYRIEEAFTKDEIIALYLNQIYFGNGAYGVEEAAQTYFGKHVGELTLAECAVMAAIPKSPTKINPVHNPNRTLQRRAYVLGQMQARGLASAEDVAQAMTAPLFRDRPPPEFLGRAPYYAEEVRRELVKRFGEDAVFHDGLVAYAAVDARLDVLASRALQAGLRDVDRRRGFRGPLIRVDPDEMKGFVATVRRDMEDRLPPNPAERALLAWDWTLVTAAHVRMGEEGASQVRIVYRDVGGQLAAVVESIAADGREALMDLGTTRGVLPLAEVKWARPRLPSGELGPPPKGVGDVLRPGDVVLVRITKEAPVPGSGTATVPQLSLEQRPDVQGAVVAVEPETRRVRAMVGGMDFRRSSFNRATQARRQPGSSFKPFIYAAAIKSRAFTPATILVDAPKVFVDRGAGRDWKPENSDGRFRGDIRLRECLTHSVNICSITLVEALTPPQVIGIARKVGLGDAWPDNLTLALGTGEVTPLALANAYATFADEGRYAPPVVLEKVKNAEGKVLWEAQVEKVEVFDPATAFVTLSMMKSVVEAGTARRVKELGRPVAGKTGTTSEARDAWFGGCVPGMCSTVFIGMDNNEPLGPAEAGGRAAAPVFLDFYRAALEGAPIRDFEPPAGVEIHAIDPKTGLLAAESQADAMAEVFLEGTAPTEVVSPGGGSRPDEWRDDEAP